MNNKRVFFWKQNFYQVNVDANSLESIQINISFANSISLFAFKRLSFSIPCFTINCWPVSFTIASFLLCFSQESLVMPNFPHLKRNSKNTNRNKEFVEFFHFSLLVMIQLKPIYFIHTVFALIFTSNWIMSK